MQAQISYQNGLHPTTTVPIFSLSDDTLIELFLEHSGCEYDDQQISRDSATGLFLVMYDGADVARILIK